MARRPNNLQQQRNTQQDPLDEDNNDIADLLSTEDDDLSFDDDTPADIGLDDDDDTTGPVVETDDDLEEGTPARTEATDDQDQDDSATAEDIATPDIYSRFEEDRNGNLMFNKKVLVKRGRPRQVFDKVRKELFSQAQTAQRTMGQLQELAKGTKTLYERYRTLEQQQEALKGYHLEPTEMKEAAELFALAKTDARTAIKRVLTKAHLAGIDLTDLGITGPVDAREVALHTMRLQEDARKQAQPTTAPVVNQDQVRANALAEDFLNRNPDAAPFVQAIGNAKNQYPHLSFDHIWQQLKEWRAAQGPGQGKPPAKPKPHENRRQESAPNRRGKLSTTPVAPNSSFEDIGKQLLRDIKAIEERNGNS